MTSKRSINVTKWSRYNHNPLTPSPHCIHKMATPPPAPSSPSPWSVYYFDGFSGRAQPLYFLLEDSSTQYSTLSKQDLLTESDSCMALPAAKSPSSLLLSQTTAVAAWMGDELGSGAYAVGPRHVSLARQQQTLQLVWPNTCALRWLTR